MFVSFQSVYNGYLSRFSHQFVGVVTTALNLRGGDAHVVGDDVTQLGTSSVVVLTKVDSYGGAGLVPVADVLFAGEDSNSSRDSTIPDHRLYSSSNFLELYFLNSTINRNLIDSEYSIGKGIAQIEPRVPEGETLGSVSDPDHPPSGAVVVAALYLESVHVGPVDTAISVMTGTPSSLDRRYLKSATMAAGRETPSRMITVLLPPAVLARSIRGS